MLKKFGIAAYMYDIKIIKSMVVRYSSFGNSESITKLYAIKASNATIEVVNLASNFGVGIHRTDQATHKIKNTGIIILNT